MGLKKVGMSTIIWGLCCLLGNLGLWVSAQDALPPEQDPAAEHLTIEEQSWRVSAFYRTIVDNNLFRPLGWTPPKPKSVYRLLGTVILTDGTSIQAILQDIASERLHFVTVGDKVGNATVHEILPKQVKLDKGGQVVTLKLNTLQFLSPTRARGAAASSQSAAQTSAARTYESPTDKIKSVSKEERRRLIQRYAPK